MKDEIKDKLNPTIEPISTEQFAKQEFFRGSQLYKSPQDALTAADATSFTSSTGAGDHVDASAIAILNNMRTRINELETRIQNLKLIKEG